MLDEEYSFDFSKTNLYDVIHNPYDYKWIPSFIFKGRRSKRRAGGYGQTIDNQELYEKLNDPFIENYFAHIFPNSYVKKLADKFVINASKELFPFEDEIIGFTDKELKKLNINKKRFLNAEDRFITAESKFHEAENELYNLKNKHQEISFAVQDTKDKNTYLYSIALRRKSGDLDRRTRAYRTIKNNEENIKSMQEALQNINTKIPLLNNKISELNKLFKDVERKRKTEKTRYENSQERVRNSIANAKRMAEENFNSFSDKIKKEGKHLAEEVRDDIIRKVINGECILKHGVSDITKKARMRAGLDPTPRYWASKQFLNSLVVVFRLEKR